MRSKKVEKLRKYHLRLFDLDWCKSRHPHIVLVQHFSSCKLYHGTAVSLNPLLVQTMTSSPKNTLRHSFRDPSHSSPPPPPRFNGAYQCRSPPRRRVYWRRSHRCLFLIGLWHLYLCPPPLKGAPQLETVAGNLVFHERALLIISVS